MKLKHLSISNCSRIRDLDIDVRDNLVLIGPNGSGKTTVLLCLEMLLGMSEQRLRATVTKDFVLDESRPFTVQALLGDLSADEATLFPDEIGALGMPELAVRLDVAIGSHGDLVGTWSFPRNGVLKPLSQAQRDAFGWMLLQAHAGPSDARRTFQTTASNASPAVGPSVSVGANAANPDAGASIGASVADSGAGASVGASAANPSTGAMPAAGPNLGTGPSAAEGNVSDAENQMATIDNLLHEGANIIAIDEPEAHLHPSSQRSLAKMLQADGSQKVLVTHSPTIAGSFEPDEIVVIRSDGLAVQPEEGFLRDDAGMLARWWIGRQLEPLTAGTVVAVEGPSDRIIVNQVASALGFDLDRNDVVVVETDGCGDMKAVKAVFGKEGFDIPLFVLVDDDARQDTARRFGADADNPADLEAHGVFVSRADLEDEYVRAIGPERLWDKLRTTRTFSENVMRQCRLGRNGYPSAVDLAAFIRAKSNRKIPSALMAASLLDASSASNVKSVAELLRAVSS